MGKIIMTSSITYLPNDTELLDFPLWWHKRGLQQTASGYGLKLTTRYKVRHNGRLWRVYATCISNAASHWILVKGQKLHLDWIPGHLTQHCK
tara:strand:+ start:456 stop:731 length:276 start_codon:yes stop_codon:yes gene_type:complete